METRLPCPSRVVWNRSLVRPIILLPSSRSTEDVSLKPVVTEPMILRFPSRTYSFFSLAHLPPGEVYVECGKNGQFWRVI
jgi:hypothetical protein